MRKEQPIGGGLNAPPPSTTKRRFAPSFLHSFNRLLQHATTTMNVLIFGAFGIGVSCTCNDPQYLSPRSASRRSHRVLSIDLCREVALARVCATHEYVENLDPSRDFSVRTSARATLSLALSVSNLVALID